MSAMTAHELGGLTFDEVVAYVEGRSRADRLSADRALMAAFDDEYARADAAGVDDSGVIPAVLGRFPLVTATQLLRAGRQVIAEAERMGAFRVLLEGQLARAGRDMPPGGDPALMGRFAQEVVDLVATWPAGPRLRSVA